MCNNCDFDISVTHRKLAEQLDLFFFHEFSAGMPYWLPNGLIVRNLLVQFWREVQRNYNYKEVQSPQLNKNELWKISGHWDHYQNNMMLASLDEGSDDSNSENNNSWALKPMNCPNHMMIWKHKPRSYKELPLRLSEISMLHRNEKSGALSGLFRVRCFSTDDSHIFILEEQIEFEVRRILEIAKGVYKIFSLENSIKLYFSTRPDDFMGDINLWNFAEEKLRNVLDSFNLPYEIKEKDGAFYGPKIDIHIKDSLNREWQCGTIQLDFQLPRKFNLQYVASDGSRKIPIVVHQAIFGSIERFLGILLEHLAGKLPFWLSPVQIKLIPIASEKNSEFIEYEEKIKNILDNSYLSKPISYSKIRYELDSREESLSRKIKDAALQKVPVVIIFGKKELESNSVVIRINNIEREIKLELLLNEFHNL